MFQQSVESTTKAKRWTVTVYTAHCGQRSLAKVEKVHTYRWWPLAWLRSVLSYKMQGEGHMIRRWRRDPIDLARWSVITKA